MTILKSISSRANMRGENSPARRVNPDRGGRGCIFRGGMAERPKAVVLKTTERKLRGFESLSLRHL